MANDFQNESSASADGAPLMPSTSVGATLRASRERMGRDLDSVAKQLLIRQPFLQALEEGRHKDLPGGTYAIGFLRTYSEFLGLDGEEMVRRFRQEAAGELNARSELVFPSPVSEGRIPTGAKIFVGLVVAGLAYGGWFWMHGRHGKVAEMVPPLPERLESVLNRPAGVAAESKAPAAGTETPVAAKTVEPSPDRTAAAAPDASQPKPADKVAVKDDVVPPAEVEDEAKGAPAPGADTAPKPAPSAEAKAQEAKPAEPVAKEAPAQGVQDKKADEKGAKPVGDVKAPPQEKAKSTAEAGVGHADSAPHADAAAPAPEAAKGAATNGDAAKGDAVAGDSRVVIKAAMDDCWMQVREMDGRLLMSRLLHKGESYGVPNRPGLSLTVGNAGAVEILVDGKKTAPLGQVGQVRRDVSLDPAKLNVLP